MRYVRPAMALVVGAALVVVAACTGEVGERVQERVADRAYETLREDVIIGADIWDPEPKMMSASLGFTSIIGVPGLSTDELDLSKNLVWLAGGTWNTVECANDEEPSLGAFTSAATPEGVGALWGEPTYYADGLPVVFSWPVLPSSVRAQDFAVTLTTGQVVTPEVASIWPNFEYNERSVVVLFGYFGNRISPEEPGAIFPEKVEVLDDDETTLTLVGPDEEKVSAAGFSLDGLSSPYTDPDVAPEDRGGPRLAAAKLSRYSSVGDTGPRIFRSGLLPNDGESLYGDRAQYRLRVYTTGGMTADGVRAVFPTDFARFFRVQVESDAGDRSYLTETGTSYEIDGFTIQVEGLADLGVKADVYTDCYTEDRDNYIDIILSGDEEAARKIVAVEIPSTGEYSPLYNPGGPGNDPVPGVRYTAPSPPIAQEVLMALDDPMTVTYPNDADEGS